MSEDIAWAYDSNGDRFEAYRTQYRYIIVTDNTVEEAIKIMNELKYDGCPQLMYRPPVDFVDITRDVARGLK